MDNRGMSLGDVIMVTMFFMATVWIIDIQAGSIKELIRETAIVKPHEQIIEEDLNVSHE